MNLDMEGQRGLGNFGVGDEGSSELRDVLRGNVQEVKDRLEGFSKRKYPDFLELERDWKNRKTVTEFLELEISRVPEADDRTIRSAIVEFVVWVTRYPEYPEKCLDEVERQNILFCVPGNLRGVGYAFVETEEVEEELEYLLEQGVLIEKDGWIRHREFAGDWT